MALAPRQPKHLPGRAPPFSSPTIASPLHFLKRILPKLLRLGQAGYITPEQDASISAGTPLRRVGLPEDIADVILFLASEQARWLTGQLLYVGGGWRMSQKLCSNIISKDQYGRHQIFQQR
jgi:NAD(P)-dependent dehydrogenase (short-subunit alcohol dehydrogenase family)